MLRILRRHIFSHNVHPTMLQIAYWYQHMSTPNHCLHTSQLLVINDKISDRSFPEKSQSFSSLLVERLPAIHRRCSKHHDQISEQISQMIDILSQRPLPLTPRLFFHMLSDQIPLPLSCFSPYRHHLCLLSQVIPNKMIQFIKTKSVVPQYTHW